MSGHVVIHPSRSSAQVNTAIYAASPQFDDRVEPLPIQMAGNSTTAAFSANTAYVYKFRVAEPITVANVEIHIGATSAGTVDLGICTSADAGVNLTRVASTGATAAGTANAVQAIALTAAYALVPGTDYYAAFVPSDATLTVLRLGTIAVAFARSKRGRQVAAGGATIPASFAAGTTGTGAQIWLAFTT